MSVTSPVTGRVTGIVTSGVTRAIGHRTRVAFDADALTYIAAVEAADDETLEDGVKSAINTFIKGCKADGDWDAIKASCIMAGARTLAGCLVPLVGAAPTNVGPFVSGDYNRITGLVGNGSTKYLNSNRNNNADPQDSSHNAVYIGEVGTTDTGSVFLGCGISDTGANTVQKSVITERFVFRNRSSDVVLVEVSPATGMVGVTRSAAGTFSSRVTGTATNHSLASQTPFNGNMLVFARGTAASPETLTDYRLSFYSIGESLNLENLDTRVTTLMTAIGEALA